MYRMNYKFIWLLLLLIWPLAAEESFSIAEPLLFVTTNHHPVIRRNPGFQLDTNILLKSSLLNPDSTQEINYQHIILQPMYNWHALTIMLNFDLKFAFSAKISPPFNIKQFHFKTEDWVPISVQSGLETYLPRLFIEYGRKNENIHFIYGELNNINIGNRTIVRNYRNTADNDFSAAGLYLKIDAQEFAFPYLSIETMLGDISHLDAFAMRTTIRPLAFLSNNYWEKTEISFISAIDRENNAQGLIADLEPISKKYLLLLGSDFRVPLYLNNQNKHRIELFGDFLWQNSAILFSGGMRSQLANIFLLETSIDYMQPQTIYALFNYHTPIFGTDYLDIPQKEYLGAQVRLALFFLDGIFQFEIQGKGPIINIEQHQGFTIGGEFRIQENKETTWGTFHMAIYYQKKFIHKIIDLLKLENTIIGGKIGISFPSISIELNSELRPRYSFVRDQDSPSYHVTIGLQGVVSF